jgi:hypothetical protein
MKMKWKVEARDRDGRVSASYHSTKDEATRADFAKALSGEKTIWNSDGTDGPCLICAPPKEAA